jgi:Mg-chelatase subunit ChlD
MSTQDKTNTHIYVLIDRSGSMAPIAADVIGGFNTFLEQQTAAGDDAVVTLVQFDSQDPQEVIVVSTPITEVAPLTGETFVPRGSTPLLDATGQLIARAKLNVELRASNNLPAENIVFVTITDGEENASREYTHAAVKELIAACEKEGWTFVFLSAALDAYGDAQRMGVGGNNTQAFESSSHGVELAFSSLSDNLLIHRTALAKGTKQSKATFFGSKPAEKHRNK